MLGSHVKKLVKITGNGDISRPRRTLRCRESRIFERRAAKSSRPSEKDIRPLVSYLSLRPSSRDRLQSGWP